MYVPVETVEPLDDYKLRITFKNGEAGIFDLSPYLSMGKFAELRNPALFKTVRVKFDSIEWSNQLDLDPEFLYDKSVRTKSA